MEWDWITRKPGKIKRTQEDSGRIRYLTVEQATRLLEAAKKDPRPTIYPFIAIGLETSIRRMEILSIQLEHIDLARHVIYIPQAKAGAHEQPITATLLPLLRRMIAAAEPDQKWLFPAEQSSTGHTVNVEKPFPRVVVSSLRQASTPSRSCGIRCAIIRRSE